MLRPLPDANRWRPARAEVGARIEAALVLPHDLHGVGMVGRDCRGGSRGGDGRHGDVVEMGFAHAGEREGHMDRAGLGGP